MSWFAAFAGFAALIILHELGHFAAAKAVGMRVERFALFFPPLIWKIRRGETEYGIGAIPLGGYVRITGMNPNEELSPEVSPRAYYNQPAWKRIVVIAAGPVTNLVVAFLILLGLFMFKGEATATNTAVIDQVTKGSPAATTILPGDKVVAVDGVSGTFASIRRQIGSHRCAGNAKTDGCRATEPVKFTVRRAGQLKDLSVTPVYDAAAKRMRVGIVFAADVTYDRSGPVTGSGQALSAMWRVTRGTVSALVRLVYDKESRKEVSGVVGNYEVTRQVIKHYGFVDAMNIIAIISLSLAIVNLFPFLPLDGGHIFWAVAERIRGRAIPFSVMERASVFGFLLVIALFALGLTNDIDRLRGDGFGVP